MLQEGSFSPALVQEKILKCQHCHWVDYMEDQCFDLHPYEHCRKHNHPSNRCSKCKKHARVKNQYGRITSWWWSSTTKKIYHSYWIIHSWVLTHLAMEIFYPLTLHLTGGNNINDWHTWFKFQIPINWERTSKPYLEPYSISMIWFVDFAKPPFSIRITTSARQLFVVTFKSPFENTSN